MDRCGSHVLLNPVFSKTLRGFVAFLKVCPGVGVLVWVRSLEISIQRGFRRVGGVVEGLVRGIIKGVMPGSRGAILLPSAGIIGMER